MYYQRANSEHRKDAEIYAEGKMTTQNLTDYINLIESFLSNQISAPTFERAYLTKFKNDATDWSETEYEILNQLFGDLDAFCADPELRGQGDLDEVQLRHSAAEATRRLLALEVRA